MPIVLRARALWKSYAAGVAGCSARVWVLRGASVEVEQGECVAVLGARGSGTTTLLHCLAGLRRPDAGSIEHMLPPRLIVGARLGGGESDADALESLVLCDDDVRHDDSMTHWSRQAQHRMRGAMVVATHDLSSVRQMVDRVLLLRDGRLTQLDRSAGVRRVAERARSVVAGTTPRE